MLYPILEQCCPILEHLVIPHFKTALYHFGSLDFENKNKYIISQYSTKSTNYFCNLLCLTYHNKKVKRIVQNIYLKS